MAKGKHKKVEIVYDSSR